MRTPTTLATGRASNRRGPLALAGLALVVGAGGCGGEAATNPDVPTEVQPLGAPGNPVTPGNLASTLTEAQVQARTAHLDATLTGDGETITVSGSVAVGWSLGEPEFALTYDQPEGQVTVVRVDRDLYVKMPGLADGKYVHSSVDEDNLLTLLVDTPMQTVSPAALTDSLEDATGVRRTEDTAQIDGTGTTRYRATAHQIDLMDSLCPSDGIPEVGATQRLDLWVGDEDMLPRRIECSLSGDSTVVDLTDWGEATVEPPDDSEITDDPSPM